MALTTKVIENRLFFAKDILDGLLAKDEVITNREVYRNIDRAVHHLNEAYNAVVTANQKASGTRNEDTP